MGRRGAYSKNHVHDAIFTVIRNHYINTKKACSFTKDHAFSFPSNIEREHAENGNVLSFLRCFIRTVVLPDEKVTLVNAADVAELRSHSWAGSSQ